MTQGVIGRLRRLLRWAFIAFSAICLLAVSVAMLSRWTSSDTTWLVVIFVVLPIGAFVATFVHEAGHAAAARAVGWRVIAFAVGPFVWQIPNRHLAIGGALLHPDAGGYVAAVPGSVRVHTRLRSIVLSAGGPAASLAVALGMLALWAVMPEPRTGAAGLYAVLGGLSFVAFLVTALPIHGNADATHILRLIRTPWSDDGVRWAGWVRFQLNYNVRLRDIPPWMHQLSRSSKTHAEACERLFHGVEIGRALDARQVNVVPARHLIDAHRATYGGDDWLANCDALLAAIHEGDLDRAEAALAAAPNIDTTHELRLAARAAIAARRGDRASATTLLRLMDQRLRKTSPLLDPTFRDIRRQIERIASLPP